MSGKIEAALSAADWPSRAANYKTDKGDLAIASAWGDGLRITEADANTGKMVHVNVPHALLPAIIALANEQLRDADPRKITRARLELAGRIDAEMEFYDFAAALESYLRPPGT